MPTDQHRSPTRDFIILFVCCFFAAGIFYGLLESTGTFETQGGRLGGAAAGFVVILIISHQIFASIQKRADLQTGTREIAERNSQIHDLKKEVEYLRASQIPKINCPTGFEIVFSKDLGVGFSRPKTWTRHPEAQVGFFMRPLTSEQRKLMFQGNIVVTATYIRSPEYINILLQRGIIDNAEQFEVNDDVLQSVYLSAAQHLKAEDFNCESTYIDGARTMRCKARYPRESLDGSFNLLEGVAVYYQEKERIFLFTLHDCEEMIQESREIFNKVISTIKFTS